MTERPEPAAAVSPTFEEDLDASRRVERALVPKEIAALLVVAVIVVLRALWLG